MLKTKAIKIEQAGIKMYLLSLKINEIKQLLEKKQLLVDVYDPLNPTGREGYQRGIDESRIKDIAEFLSKKSDILPSLLPGSIILNCRKGETIRYDDSTSEIIIGDDACFHIVDGQHRIRGLERSKIQKYEVPFTIIEGLNIAQEAGQFLTINTKQKKVRPDLQLRILYHQDRENTRRLIDILGVENWKLEALTLCIALNDKNESPWRNLILRPGEKREGRWKPITEANFVDTLKYFCSSESSIKHLPLEEKEKFLIQYWNEIRKIYEKAFTETDGPAYSLTRGLGAGIFNTLAPAIYNLKLETGEDLSSILEPLKKKIPLDYWRRPHGKIAKLGGSQKTYKTVAEDILKQINKFLNYCDEKQFNRLTKRTEVKAYLRILEKARSLLSPLILKSAQDISERDWNLMGCYVLIRLEDAVSVYVGKSQNAKKRLSQHKWYNLYAVKSCGSEREMEELEMALYHLVKSEFRENENHPSPAEYCPFCGR
jgi:DGQHR domain-containing protein